MTVLDMRQQVSTVMTIKLIVNHHPVFANIVLSVLTDRILAGMSGRGRSR